MSASAMVLVCAFDLLGRSAGQFPPIRILSAPPRGVSANAQAFLDRGEGVIYLIASAPAFRDAEAAQGSTPRPGRCPARDALKMVASIIVHEDWHARHGSDERGAYLAQLTQLNLLGAGPGTWPYHSVTRAMAAVLDAQRPGRRAPDGKVAAAR